MGLFDSFFSKAPEVQKAEGFAQDALDYIKVTKQDVARSNFTLHMIAESPEFDYWSALIALVAADYASINKFGPGSSKQKKILGAMINSFEKLNPYARRNLMFHKMFLQDMEKEGRLGANGMTIPHASGCWVLMAMKRQNAIDFEDPFVLKAGETIGNWIFCEFGSYWDNPDSDAPFS